MHNINFGIIKNYDKNIKLFYFTSIFTYLGAIIIIIYSYNTRIGIQMYDTHLLT